MARLLREPPKRSCKSYAMWLLSRKEYSAKELQGKLTGRGYPEDEAAAAVQSMQGYGFQDDKRFAENKARASARRMGNRGVTAVLVDKGVSRELAAEQLAGLEPENERVLAMTEKFIGKPLDEALKGKVWRFLAYRGFSSGAIKVAVQHLKDNAAAVDDD